MRAVLTPVPAASPTRGLRAFREQVAVARRNGIPLPEGDLSADLETFAQEIAQAQEAGVQAVGVPVGGGAEGAVVLEELLRLAEFVRSLADRVKIVRGPGDLEGAEEGDAPVVLIPVLEQMGYVTPDLTRVRGLRGMGVAIMRFSNGRRSALGDGAFEETDLGLTARGRDALQAAVDAGVAIDLAGTGRRSFLDALDAGPFPVLVGGAGAASVHDHPLNLTDRQIEGVAASGGVVCLSVVPRTLGPRGTEALADHLARVLELVGTAHVGLAMGSVPEPGDDPTPNDEPPSLANVPGLIAGLEARGFGDDALAPLLGDNVRRVLAAAWGDGAPPAP